MQHQQEQQPDHKLGLNLLNFFASAMAAPAEAVLRKPGTVGSRYFGLHAVLSFLFVPLFCVLCGSPEQLWPVTPFLGIYTLALIAHRVTRKPGMHSRYIGDSWFGTGMAAYFGWEPCCCFLLALACFLIPWFPLGCYLMAAGFSLMWNITFIKMRDDARVRDMHDATIEGRYYAERYKEE